MNTKRPSVGVERSLANLASTTQRSYESLLIPWKTFQRLRKYNAKETHANQSQGNIKTINKSTPVKKETPKFSLITKNNSDDHSKHVIERKHSKHVAKNDRWARTWANHRAQQAVLARNQPDRSRERSRSCGTPSSVRTKSMNVPRKSTSVRSRSIVLDAKAAEVFSRLRSIYVNDVERDRRLQCIRDRMNEFQKKSIKKDVNKSIQEFNKRLKEDEQNRKELRRVREKFVETKRQRLKYMHVSRNALEFPSVSRIQYGLPQEGKEFSASFSSKKTTDEIKNLWQMAIIRQQCVDTFISKYSQRQQDLPEVVVKPRLRAPSLTGNSSLCPEPHSKKVEEKEKISEKALITSLAKVQTEVLETDESSSSEEEDFS